MTFILAVGLTYTPALFTFPPWDLPGPRPPQLHLTLLDGARRYPKYLNMALVQNIGFRIYYVIELKLS